MDPIDDLMSGLGAGAQPLTPPEPPQATPETTPPPPAEAVEQTPAERRDRAAAAAVDAIPAVVEEAVISAEQSAIARAQQQRIAAAADEFEALLPAIAAASPLPPKRDRPLRGAARVAAGLRAELDALGVAGHDVAVRDDGVCAVVTIPAGASRDEWRRWLAYQVAQRKNLGVFEAYDHPREARGIYLIRRHIEGELTAWRAAGRAASAFRTTAEGQAAVFTAARLVQTKPDPPRPPRKRYPTPVEWGEDDRGPTVLLDLPRGMLWDRVKASEPALRAAFDCPDLVVDAAGVRPLIRLRTISQQRGFPATNPLKPTMFVRPRSQAERHAAAADFVLPLGVTADGAPLLISQDRRPHLGVFGATGSGKTILLTGLVQAAALQGAEVALADPKNGKDLRKLALQRLPGVVHYSAGEPAECHRIVRWIRDEFERRKQLAAELLQRGVDYVPTPLVAVLDEFPSWVADGLSSSDVATKRAMAQTVAHLNFLGQQAREQRVFLVVAGQAAYVDGFAGKLKANTRTLVNMGPLGDVNRQALFASGEARAAAAELGATITSTHRGRGIVADSETGQIQLFQGYFNAPGPAADAMTAALAKTPRLRRFAWRFPSPTEDGGDGSWQEWTPVTDPPSDSLPTLYLDDAAGQPVPELARYDPLSRSYAPGAKPVNAAHEHLPSYD